MYTKVTPDQMHSCTVFVAKNEGSTPHCGRLGMIAKDNTQRLINDVYMWLHNNQVGVTNFETQWKKCEDISVLWTCMCLCNGTTG